MLRIADERRMPFDVKAPNATRRQAIAELEAGKGKRFASVDDLMWPTCMRTIDRASAFKRDYKREIKGRHRTALDDDLKPVLVALATDQALSAKYRDHDLSGDWAGYRECHVRPDLLLIYRKSDADTLRLARLGLARTANFSVEAAGQAKRRADPADQAWAPSWLAVCRAAQTGWCLKLALKRH